MSADASAGLANRIEILGKIILAGLTISDISLNKIYLRKIIESMSQNIQSIIL